MWLMRQAGRYLAEYREVRAQAGSFLNLCYNPKLAAEVTIQADPAFGFDAAIIFSDILVVPHALGQHVEFREGEGPHLQADQEHRAAFQAFRRKGEAYIRHRLRSDRPNHQRSRRARAPYRLLRRALDSGGSMVEGQGSKDYREAKLLAYREPKTFGDILDLPRGGIERLPGRRRGTPSTHALQIFGNLGWRALPTTISKPS